MWIQILIDYCIIMVITVPAGTKHRLQDLGRLVQCAPRHDVHTVTFYYYIIWNLVYVRKKCSYNVCSMKTAHLCVTLHLYVSLHNALIVMLDINNVSKLMNLQADAEITLEYLPPKFTMKNFRNCTHYDIQHYSEHCKQNTNYILQG